MFMFVNMLKVTSSRTCYFQHVHKHVTFSMFTNMLLLTCSRILLRFQAKLKLKNQYQMKETIVQCNRYLLFGMFDFRNFSAIEVRNYFKNNLIDRHFIFELFVRFKTVQVHKEKIPSSASNFWTKFSFQICHILKFNSV